MAFHAGCPLDSGVVAMRWCVVLCCRVLMAGCAELVPLELETRRVGIVAVGAANPLVIHLALQEGSKNIDFLHDLAVVMVERGRKNGIAEMISESISPVTS